MVDPERVGAATSIKSIYSPFLITYQGLQLLVAGLPPTTQPDSGYRRIFPRDGLTKELLDPEQKTLKNWIIFVGRNLGKKNDPRTGEMPGGGPHEIDPKTGDGCELEWAPGLSTKYNTHDVTALWLIGFEKYIKLYGDRKLVSKFKEEIIRGIGWVDKHVRDGKFTIDPSLSGAKRFSLHITYWKDSQIPDPTREDPQFAYPAVVPLVQAQNIRGLESASFLLDRALGEKQKDEETRGVSLQAKALAMEMRRTLMDGLFDHHTGTFFIAQDRLGNISGASSDQLLMLYFVNPKHMSSEMRISILRQTQVLESLAGFLGIDPRIGSQLKDQYHTIVWPWENCAINRGLAAHLEYVKSQVRNNLKDKRVLAEELALLHRAETVSTYPRRYFRGTYPETLDPRNGQVEKRGCDPQLWTVAAGENYRISYPKVTA